MVRTVWFFFGWPFWEQILHGLRMVNEDGVARAWNSALALVRIDHFPWVTQVPGRAHPDEVAVIIAEGW